MIALLIPTDEALAAQAQPVHLDQQWLDLSFYKAHRRGHKSQIINGDFFLSAGGRRDPKKELETFLSRVTDERDPRTAGELMCRYPARTTFLIDRRLLENDRFDRSKCESFNNEIRPRQITKISLAFAAGYFGNPSSYYGHVLLQAGSPHTQDKAVLLDSAINYGATIGHSSSNPFYIANGIFGGYQGSFNSNNYFVDNGHYLNSQLRDVWIHDLDLTEKQVQFLIEHSWEIRQAKFDYFFFTDNCAHKIAELLVHTTGRDLMTSTGFWFMPFQLVRNLKAEGLITAEHYQPSRKTKVDHQLATLSGQEKRALTKFLLSRPAKQNRTISYLSPQSQFVALDYLDMQSAIADMKETDGQETIDASRHVILKNVYEHRRDPAFRTAAARQVADQPTSASLHDNPPPSRVGLTYAQSENAERVELNYRPAHNDLMDQFVDNALPSNFSMGEVTLAVDGSDVSLQSLDVLHVTSLSAYSLSRKLNPEYSWQLYVGYDVFDQTCDRCSVSQLRYSGGLARRILTGTAYGLAGFRLMDEYQGNGYLGLTLTSGFIVDLPGKTRILSEFEAEYLERSGKVEQRWALKGAHQFSRTVDLRLELHRVDEVTLGKVGMSWHFQ